ncbi:MAG: protein kinase [Alphaproteobacteria bacterium]|nr:protein kinase [Alphaproteobacteria bacterium]MCB9796666.1 protein kinase [Alphaproteobacteria bacterium]
MSLDERNQGDLSTWDDLGARPAAPSSEQTFEELASLPAEPVSTAERERLPVDPLSLPAEQSFVNARIIGAGSLGRVYAAEDQRLGREVACKELSLPGTARLAVAREAEARFLREARVTARLEHPNIVPIYFAGRRWDGTPFYAMKIIKGRSLRAALSACEGLEQRLGLLDTLIDICQAMAFAHARGVIHRDLKPENVMLGQFGETWVVDWGLARVMDEPDAPGPDLGGGDARQTQDGTVLGTPAYMPPEQARGQVERLDARSDVWSLGAMLFELLVGQPPHGRGALEEVLERAKHAQVPWLERVAPDAPPELRAIAAKALHRIPEQRYPHAGGLLEDLQAYRSGRPVGVYSYSTRELLGRFWERQRLPILVAAVGLVVALTISVAGFLRVLAEREVALEQGERARQAEAARAEALSQSFADKARSLSEGDPTAALLYAAHALAIGERPFARGVWAAHASRQRPRLRFARSGPTEQCRDLASSADGRTLACVGDEGLVLWDADSPRPRNVTADQVLWSVALSADGSRVAATGPGVLRVWDGEARLLHQAEGPDGPSVAISPDGARVYWVQDKRVRAWGAAWTESEKLCGNAVMAGLDVSATDLVVSCAAGAIWRLDPMTGVADGYPATRGATHELAQLSRATHDRGTWEVSLSPDGRLVAVGGLINRLFLWDLRAGELLRVLEGHESTIASISWSPDGRQLATGSKDGDVRLWDVETGRAVAKLSLFALPNSLVAFHRSGWTTLGGSGVAQDWQMNEATLPPTVTMRSGLENLLALRDGRRLLAIPGPMRDTMIHIGELLDATTGAVLAELQVEGARFIASTAAELPDGRLVLGAYTDMQLDPSLSETQGQLLVFSADGVPLEDHPLPSQPEALYLLDEGRTVVVLLRSGAVAWDVESRTLGPWQIAGRVPVLAAPGQGDEPEGALHLFLNRPSADGRRLIFVRPDGQLAIAEAPWSEPPRELGLVEPAVRHVAVAPDGRRAAVADRSGRIRVWDIDRDTLLTEVGEDGRQWSAMRFSPSGGLLAAGNREDLIRVWDVETGALLAVLEGHSHWVTRLDFLDEQRLVSGSWDNSLRVWDLSTLRTPGEALVERAERETGLRLEGARVALVGAAP